MRKPAKEASDNWIKQLMIIKEEINIGDKIHPTPLIESKNIANDWCQFLTKHKIIYKENGFLKWNERIPVSIKLVELYRKWVKNKRIIMKSILLPPPPESYKKKMKDRVKQQQEIILTQQTQTQKYGLIRSLVYYVIVPLLKKLW